jgi:Flp pilus assembly pilin Flp
VSLFKLKDLFPDERGQDLVEYTLLVGFLALGSAALFVGSGQNLERIWTVANSRLASGAGTNSDDHRCDECSDHHH